MIAGLVTDVAFVGFENLVGAANNEDGFIIRAGGSLSGTIAGGADGHDGLAIEDSDRPGVLAIVSPDGTGGGTIAAGAVTGFSNPTVTFSGIESPLFADTSVTGVVSFRGSAFDDTLTLSQVGNQLRFASDDANNRFWDYATRGFAAASVTSLLPDGTLRVQLSGGDSLLIDAVATAGAGIQITGEDESATTTFVANVSTSGGAIKVDGGTVVVNPGVVLSTRQTSGTALLGTSTGASGDIHLTGTTIEIKAAAQLLSHDTRPGAAPSSTPAGLNNQSRSFFAWKADQSYKRVATTSSGTGSGLLVDITTDGKGKPHVVIARGGTGYRHGELITIREPGFPFTSFGSITMEVNGLLDGIPAGLDNQSTPTDLWTPNKFYKSVATTVTGVGTGLRVDITTDGEGKPHVVIHERGGGYKDGDLITIREPGSFSVGSDITVQVDGLLGRGGDIRLEARDEMFAVAYGPSDVEAQVLIRDGVVIQGRDIIATATADNNLLFDETELPIYSGLKEKLGDTDYFDKSAKGLGTSVLNLLANLRFFFGYQDSDATAKVLVGDADITAVNGSVVLTADAKSEAKSFTVSPWVAATYLDSSAWSEVKVGSGALVTASRDVLINARNTNTIDATSLLFRGGRELPGVGAGESLFADSRKAFNKFQSKNPFSFTVTITTGEQHAYATVEQGAEIRAGHDVDVIARSERTLSSSATGSSRNQFLGIGFTLNLSTSTADAAVHGKVTASAGDVTVLAQTVSAKNKTVAVFDAGQSDFASERAKKWSQYLQHTARNEHPDGEFRPDGGHRRPDRHRIAESRRRQAAVVGRRGIRRRHRRRDREHRCDGQRLDRWHGGRFGGRGRHRAGRRARPPRHYEPGHSGGVHRAQRPDRRRSRHLWRRRLLRRLCQPCQCVDRGGGGGRCGRRDSRHVADEPSLRDALDTDQHGERGQRSEACLHGNNPVSGSHPESSR